MTQASKLVPAVTSVPGAASTRRSSVPTPFAHESGIYQDGMLKHTRDLRDHQSRKACAPRKGWKRSLVMTSLFSPAHHFVHKLEVSAIIWPATS